MGCNFNRQTLTFTLSNGVQIPNIGLGTSHSGGYSHSTVVSALQKFNYRLIDTAKRYGVEELLAKAIQESKVDRNSLFISTKLWPKDYGYESTKIALRGSLKRLDLDYIDLFLMHWPHVPSSCPSKWSTLSDTWRALENLYDEGLCRAIGVSNYTVDDLEQQMEFCSVVPHVNQVEFHPYQNPKELRHFCAENDIQIQGYCPLGKGHLLTDETVEQIASNYNKTAAQILIRWSVESGVATIPKSTKECRVKENIDVYDFELMPNDFALLDSLHDGRRYVDDSTIQSKIDDNSPDGYKLCLVDPKTRRKFS